MCRGKVKNGQGLRNELPIERKYVGLRNELEPFWAWKCGAPERAWAVLSVKMRGSGTSLSRFERENAGLRNELDPFWAWKCESKERPLTRGAAECFAFGRSGWASRPWEAMKVMVSGTAKFAKKCEMVMLRNGFFGNLWKWYAPERKFRAENGGLSRGTYPICIHNGSTPPPPPSQECKSFEIDAVTTKKSMTEYYHWINDLHGSSFILIQ